ncbi:hypothetical protein D3C73_1463890 [compost metagenome]
MGKPIGTKGTPLRRATCSPWELLIHRSAPSLAQLSSTSKSPTCTSSGICFSAGEGEAATTRRDLTPTSDSHWYKETK